MKLLYSLVTGLAFLAVTTETLSAIEQLPSENIGANLSAISKTLHISQWDHAYLKFQLEDVAGPVSTATLRLYYADSQAVTTKVWVASSDNWSASGSPPEEVGHAWSGGTLLGSVTNRSPGYLEI
ncbi:MAG: CBM96 family carbohydrate-binding protein, partial [bacterium]